MKSKNLLAFLLLAIVTAPSAIAQSVHDLVGVTNTLYALSVFTPTDSTVYVYQGARGGNLKTPSLQYDSAIVYTYNGGYTPYTLNLKSFNSDDTVFINRGFTWNDTTATWVLASKDNFFYDAPIHRDTDIIKQVIISGTFQNTYEYKNIFDASNNLVNQRTWKWSGSFWDSFSYSIYTYDTHNNLTQLITKTWDNVLRRYNNTDSIIYAFNSLNQDTVTMLFTYDPMVMNYLPAAITTYRYDGAGRDILNIYSVATGGPGIILPSQRDSINYNSDNNVTTIYSQSFDMPTNKFINHKLYTWTYNANKDAKTYTSNSWNGGAYMPLNGQDVQTRYYYRDTSHHLDAGNTIATGNYVHLFPVPAAGYVNIDLKWSVAQPFTIAVYDMQGRLVKQWGQAATNSLTRQLPISDLPSGNYTIRIQGTASQLTQKLVIQH
ncbi:MAG: T9SS type A sorting domain-containing protein [Taibaiella sp.]|nr:T9SS type A sorting domain-containing protein [Taibaiella sp.]